MLFVRQKTLFAISGHAPDHFIDDEGVIGSTYL